MTHASVDPSLSASKTSSTAACSGQGPSVAAEVAPVRVRDLGRQPYAPVWRAMQGFTDARNANTDDELWWVEHDPVFTLGQAAKAEHVLMPGEIPVLNVDRGGQVTYHGPGQIVAYPLLDLKRLKIGVRDYVCKLEQSVIDTLAHWNLHGERVEQHGFHRIQARRPAEVVH